MSFTAILKADPDDFNKGLDQAQERIDTFAKKVGDSLTNIGQKFQSVGGYLSLGVTAPLTAIGVAAYNMAADFEDALGATDQIFKQSSEGIKEWATNLESYFGISSQEALEYQNLMGSMLVNIGKLTEDQAAKQGSKLIQLAGDLTAMYGGQTQDAVRALTGALKGNNTMLDNYGMAVNDSIVKTRALELGLVKQGKEMSLAAKQAATLSLIYEQSAAAQGQAAREADGASGSMRALKTEITNLTTEIGTMLLPMITPLVNKVKEVVGWFKNLQPETKKLIVIIGAAAAAIGPLLIGLGAILKLTPLVGAAFTVITGPIGIAVTAIGAAAGAIIYFWDDIKRGVLNAVAAIQRGIAGVFEKMAGWAAKLGFDSVSQSLKDLSGEFSYFANNTTQQASEIGQGIDGLSDSFKGITQVPLAETVDLTSLSLDNLGNSVTKTQKETRNFRNELDDLMASWGSYEAKLKVLNREYTEISSIAKKAGASVGEMQTIASRKWVDRALLEFGRFTGGLNELPLTIKTFDLTPKITVPDILPNFDEALKLVDAKSKMFVDKFQLMTDDIKNILETGIENSVYNMFDSIGNAFATGGSIIGAIGDSLVAGLGSLASNIGKQMIAFGVAGIALKKLMMNPYLAVAAGAALVALGSFATSSVSKQTSSYSGGYSSSSNNIGAQSNDYSKFRGALYNDDKQVVELKLKNGELTGAIKIGANRNNRLG